MVCASSHKVTFYLYVVRLPRVYSLGGKKILQLSVLVHVRVCAYTCVYVYGSLRVNHASWPASHRDPTPPPPPWWEYKHPPPHLTQVPRIELRSLGLCRNSFTTCANFLSVNIYSLTKLPAYSTLSDAESHFSDSLFYLTKALHSLTHIPQLPPFTSQSARCI